MIQIKLIYVDFTKVMGLKLQLHTLTHDSFTLRVIVKFHMYLNININNMGITTITSVQTYIVMT